MALPNSYRWSDDADGGAHLYQNYGCVAVIKPDGRTRLKSWQKEFHSKAANVAQAKRFIERWINARSSPRARDCARVRYAKKSDPMPSIRQMRAITSHLTLFGSSNACLSSRTIKIDYLLDDFEQIADVHQSLAPFMRRQVVHRQGGGRSELPANNQRLTICAK